MQSMIRLGLIAVLSSMVSPAVAEKEKVTGSYLPIVQALPFYVAMEQGRFEQAGIDMNARRLENPNIIIDSLVSNQADFGPPGAASGITALAEAQYPGTFKVYSFQGGGIKSGFVNDALIVGADSGMDSFEDLEGRSVGTVPGVQWQTILTHILEANGLAEGDVDMRSIAVGQQLTSVASDAIDASLSLEPIGSLAKDLDNVRIAEENPAARYVADPFFGGVGILTTRFINERPKVARKVVEILGETTKLVNENFEKYRSYLPKYTALSEKQAEVVRQPLIRRWDKIEQTDIEAYQALVDVFKKQGVLDEQLNVEEMMLEEDDF